MKPEELRKMMGLEQMDYEEVRASSFVEIICEKLKRFGTIEREVMVANRGDGRRGRIDIVFHYKGQAIPIEIDRSSVRAKSMFKVRLYNPLEAFCITRSPLGIYKM